MKRCPAGTNHETAAGPVAAAMAAAIAIALSVHAVCDGSEVGDWKNRRGMRGRRTEATMWSADRSSAARGPHGWRSRAAAARTVPRVPTEDSVKAPAPASAEWRSSATAGRAFGISRFVVNLVGEAGATEACPAGRRSARRVIGVRGVPPG